MSISAQVTGGGEGFKTLSEIVKTAVIISDATTMNKNVGDAIAKTFEGHKRDNAGTGAMVVYSYKTIGWDPVRAILWSDEYEDKLKACAKLFTNAESLKEAVDTTRRDQGIQLPIRDKLAALSIRYDDYIKELKMHGRELIKKNPNFLKRKFPDAPRLDQETEAALFMRYAGFLERLEGVEREKHDKIEIEVRSIKSTDGVVKEIGGENVPKDVPGKERFVFQKKHARYEVFVTDVDITFPGSGDHSEIQSMRMTAKVLDFKESTDTVHVEYRLFIKSEHKRFAFKGTAKLIVIGY